MLHFFAFFPYLLVLGGVHYECVGRMWLIMGNLPVTESGVTEGEGSHTVDMVWVDTVWIQCSWCHKCTVCGQCGQERGEPQCGYAAHGVIQVGMEIILAGGRWTTVISLFNSVPLFIFYVEFLKLVFFGTIVNGVIH